ncbi:MULTISPECIES: type II toxin-antitoxin system ParD family antitoxin [Sphingomonas]|uniref:type II toxin-antitoxin system ParD family antitoxin n=1 Tax=Sphingomonas TaxID=13687 RepID=UPI00083689F3|nr:type II toxin-antitoxin system ParD family antitoxin [Sphingomonas sp. CCH10-B3]
MRNTSIALSDHWVKFTADLVASGRYGSTSEVVREGLRLVEAREAMLVQLRAALIEGENSGPVVPWDLKEFLAEMHAEHQARQ